MEIRHKTRITYSKELLRVFDKERHTLNISAKKAIRVEIYVRDDGVTMVSLTNAEGKVEGPVELISGQAMTVDHVFTLEDQVDLSNESPFPLIFTYNGIAYQIQKTKPGGLLMNRRR